MEFTLYYRGPLSSNGSRRDKHALRAVFNAQLQNLWNRTASTSLRPLSRIRPDILGKPYSKMIGPLSFAAFVTEGQMAELEVTMLRPEPPGAIIVTGGDIDNRLKTLLDALRIPSDQSELPDGAAPTPDQDCFFCLLEDDRLVTGVAVRTYELLEPDAKPPLVVLVIQVRTKLVDEPRVGKLRSSDGDV